jgi:hypothetical protein
VSGEPPRQPSPISFPIPAGALNRPTHFHFDYRLIQGAPKSTNAIRILEFLGVPDGIIRDPEREHRRAKGTDADPVASGQ